MKKASIILFVLFLGITLQGFSQTEPKDFFSGKWEISVAGTPNGDVKLFTNLTRKDGKLTGELVNPADQSQPKMPITRVEEANDKLSIYFESTQAGEISIDLAKVDDDNLKGSLFSFDAAAKRIKN